MKAVIWVCLSITFVFGLLGITPVVQAKLTEKDFNVESILERNPFDPQLPFEVPEEVLVPVQTVVVKPVEQQKPTEPVVHFDPLKFIVKGIIWDSSRPQAIINNQVFNVGDSFEKVGKIVAIDKNGVQIAVAEQTVTLTP